ncbi:hypothetical protein BFL43_11170 [Williamsia sp. 1135]|nr:hypothetical protein BFL43_11170 [Williamsia sp. 1135]
MFSLPFWLFELSLLRCEDSLRPCGVRQGLHSKADDKYSVPMGSARLLEILPRPMPVETTCAHPCF